MYWFIEARLHLTIAARCDVRHATPAEDDLFLGGTELISRIDPEVCVDAIPTRYDALKSKVCQ